MIFFKKLESRINASNSLLCIGLDPHKADLPEPTAEAAQQFCLTLIAQTAPYAAAFKPNSAFFEVFGAEGSAALKVVIAAIPDDILVILDAKRGDIASTASAYAAAAFDELGADAITISPYLGEDSVLPFLSNPNHGAFMLCRTSNAGGADLQELMLNSGEMVYEKVAELTQRWNTNQNLGLVVGATQPEALARVRAAAPNVWFLVPGIGAQGGDLASALAAGLRIDGSGMLINASRSVARADHPAEAAKSLRDAINSARKMPNSPPHKFSLLKQRIADGLLDSGCVKFGQFKLKSSQISPIYIDLRRLVGFPKLLTDVARAYAHSLRELNFEHLAALPYAALPIATAVSLQGGWSMIYPRKEIKNYGTSVAVEGVYQTGDTAVVIDDLISTGGSKFESIDKLTAAGLKVCDIVVLIDRQPVGQDVFAAQDLKLHAVFKVAELLEYWFAKKAITTDQALALEEFGLWKKP